MQPQRNTPAIHTAAYTTWMGPDGIARTVVKGSVEIGLKEARENTEAINTLFCGKKFPLLVDARSIHYMTREARDHFSIKNRETVINCFAILVQSPLSRIIGNFFMSLNKPSVPARLFTDERDALQWLEKFR